MSPGPMPRERGNGEREAVETGRHTLRLERDRREEGMSERETKGRERCLGVPVRVFVQVICILDTRC